MGALPASYILPKAAFLPIHAGMKQFQTIFALLLLVLASACSSTKTDRVIGSWQVMVASPGKSSMLCYAGAEPTSSKGTIEERSAAPYLMITRRTSGKIEVSMSSGYAYKHKSKAELAIDGKTYRMFFKDNVAWTRSDKEDKVIIEALKKAKHIEVRGMSDTGSTSVDTYSGDGFTAALARIRKLCP
jgi:uncharacterized protein YfiM (DUF2279 family)